MKEEFSKLLLEWYKINARSLPWRGHPDPYAVWVSEIMLQQTRVETVLPYFQRWIKQFPSIPALAEASEQEVLKAWEGLGYYSRARSLYKAAQLVSQEYGGSLPSDPALLLKLPGIGAYTAAAISSIAFGLDEAVVDGNVKRVLARVLEYCAPVNTPAAEKELRAIARSLLPEGSAGDYNQAIMDLGATLCTPRSPACGRCPVSSLCAAFKNSLQEQLPVVLEKPAIPHYLVTAAILRCEGRVLIARRPANGLLGGMWEFPGGKVEPGETDAAALARELQEELGIHVEVGEQLGTYRHAYTHFRVTLHAYYASADGQEPQALEASELRWVGLDELEDFPMGKIDRMISRDLLAKG